MTLYDFTFFFALKKVLWQVYCCIEWIVYSVKCSVQNCMYSILCFWQFSIPWGRFHTWTETSAMIWNQLFATANYLELVRIAITERRDISTAELLVFLHTCQLSAVDVWLVNASYTDDRILITNDVFDTMMQPWSTIDIRWGACPTESERVGDSTIQHEGDPYLHLEWWVNESIDHPTDGSALPTSRRLGQTFIAVMCPQNF